MTLFNFLNPLLLAWHRTRSGSQRCLPGLWLSPPYPICSLYCVCLAKWAALQNRNPFTSCLVLKSLSIFSVTVGWLLSLQHGQEGPYISPLLSPSPSWWKIYPPVIQSSLHHLLLSACFKLLVTSLELSRDVPSCRNALSLLDNWHPELYHNCPLVDWSVLTLESLFLSTRTKLYSSLYYGPSREPGTS